MTKRNPDNPNSERITIQLPPDEKEYIEARAERNGRSTSRDALEHLRRTYEPSFKPKALQKTKKG